ncbi:MAG: diguanylate cyclase (GGDEF)-like protein [Gammaproteobacteria bacterium]|jgi:diguanylate cyclase (GGDEF)-like protein
MAQSFEQPDANASENADHRSPARSLFFDTLLSSGLDRATCDPAVLRRVNLVNLGAIAGVATATVAGAVYIWISSFLSLLHFMTATGFLAVFLLLRITHRPLLCARIGITWLATHLLVVCWHLDGLHGVAFSWLVMLPISAAFLVNTRDAKFWLAADIVFALSFYAAEQLGLGPQNIVAEEFQSLVNLQLYVSFFVVAGILIMTWLSRHRNLENRLTHSLKETAEETLLARALADAATIANEGATFDTAVKGCMEILCQSLGWEAAQLWIRNDDGTVIPASITTMNCAEFSALFDTADNIVGANRNYLPRIVADTGLEILQGDLSGDRRAQVAIEIGVQSVFEWPLAFNGKVENVLEFISREPVEITARGKRLLEHASLQLAHVRARELARRQIEQLAYYDVVTGLPNRHAFERRFSTMLESAANRHRKLALMFIDLDGFKRVNDSLGHAAGDTLLDLVGEKLNDNLRGSDLAIPLSSPGAAMIARMGGDEFTVVLQNIDGAHGAQIVANRFLNIVSKPFEIEGNEVFITASIGIAMFPDDGESQSDLLRLADAAMYEAKNATGNQLRFATPALNESIRRRIWMTNELRNAIESDVAVHYQPIADARNGVVLGFEALARWQHAGQWIPPSEFIQMAEDTGLIHTLGDRVILAACNVIVTHNTARETNLTVSVNVSPHQLRQEYFVEGMTKILADAQCLPEWLILELTESSLLRDNVESLKVLDALKALGLNIAIDDFGTGYAALSYLRKFPLDYVKIDRSFVEHIDENSQDMAIVKAIINMSHALDLKVIAEGVETERQASALQAIGCDALQGFYIGHAQPETGSSTL